MKNYIEPTILPYNKYNLKEYIPKIKYVLINKNTIQNFCKKINITPNIFFISALNICLSKYTNNTIINYNDYIFDISNRTVFIDDYLNLIKDIWDLNEFIVNLNDDIVLTIDENKDNFLFKADFNSNLYTDDYIEKFLKSIKIITNQFINHDLKKIRIKDIVLRYEEPVPEFKLLRNPLVNELINEQANKTPDKIAIRLSDKKYTYSEINKLSNKVANSLIKKGICKGSKILFMLPRDINLILAFIGIIKAGCIAIPLDTNYPKERIEYIQKNSQSDYIITNQDFKNNLKMKDLLNNDDDSFPNINLNADDPIFILYTSGSTGKPKGVISTHKGISNLITVHIKTNYKKLLSISSISFDIAEEDILVCLTNEIELIFANDDEINNIILLSRLIEKTKPEFVNLTPSRLFSYLQVPEFTKAIKYFKGLGAGGETFTKTVYESIRLYTDADIYNGYGPAETSLTSNSKKITDPNFISNGKPLLNYITDVRDLDDKLLPFGVMGELYIGGIGVSKGYYNQKEKTKESFIKINNIPYYKTGDNAIQLPDNEIIIKGRIDNQIKLRGQRVELDEIEYLINNYPKIKKAIVIIQKINSEDHICAYLTSENNINTNEIKNYLKDKLPKYMIPTIFMQIDEIPETLNGKTDKKKLPKPIIKTNKVKPITDLEKEIFNLCADIINHSNFGITDNLYYLGFSSLTLMKLNSDIYHKLGFSLKFEDILTNPIIKQICHLIEINKNYFENKIPNIKSNQKNYYPMSSQQKRLYVLYKKNPTSTLYNLPQVIKLNNDINISKLESIINDIIQDEEILRTSFHIKNREYIQKIHTSRPIKIEEIKKDGDINPDEIISKYMVPFNLKSDRLLRFKIIKNDNETYLFRDIHHIISDQISNELIQNRIIKIYKNKNYKKNNVQYKDYTYWVLNHQNKEENYWKNKGLLKTPTEIISDFKRPLIQTYNGNTISQEINKKEIERQAKENNTSIYKLLCSEFLVLLHKYTQDSKIQIGTITSGRTHHDLENALGMFVNTLPLIQKINPNNTLKKTIKETNKEINELFSNQNYSIDKIIQKLDINVDTSHNPLFNFVFSQNTIEDNEELYNYHSSKFDLTCNIVNSPSKLIIRIEYNTDLFSEKRIKEILKHYSHIINNFDNNLNKKIKNIKILSKPDEKKLIEKFNNTKTNINDKKAITLFKNNLLKNPDKIILYDDNTHYTYTDLNNITNSLANYLQDVFNIKNQDKILYVGKRSVNRIFAFYSILKLNGIYIPCNATIPKKRLETIINDSQAKIILTDDLIPDEFNIPIVNLNNSELYDYNNDDVEIIPDDSDLIAIIYTSGTTGTPKGVKLSNKNIANLLLDSQYNPIQKDIKENANIIYDTCNITFDLSLSNTLHSILFGIPLYVINENFDFTKIPNEIITKRNYIINTPTLLKSFLSIPSFINIIKHSKIIALIGETLTESNVELIRNHSNCKIYNLYGPAETTCFVTYKLCEIGNINIGKPLANTQIYILNKEKQICPPKVLGEICISGEQVSSGYLNNEKETNKRFINNPYDENKIYKTGDLGYWDENGEIHFIGRSDLQIKINGQRIETSEINTQIQKTNPKIIDVVTIANSDKTQLYSYLTAKETINAQNIIDQLYDILPTYMIPISIIQLDELPLNNNGKIDIKKLPKSKKTNIEYVKPSTDIEKLMVNIWEKILEIHPIGINDNFYHIGGDSIKAIRIIANLNQKGYNLSPELLMSYPTIKHISKHIKKLTIELEDPTQINGLVTLTTIQKEFFNRKLEKPHHYNQSLLLKIDEINTNWLKNAFNIITQKHPTLRAICHDNNLIIQKYTKDKHFMFYEYNIKNINEINDIGHEIQSSIDLTNGPLIKIALIHENENDYILIVIHHLVIDGISWRIILDNLESLYQNINYNIKEYSSFIKWSKSLEDYKKNISNSEKKYWHHIENNIKPIFKQSNNPDLIINDRLILNKEIVHEILFKANKRFNTKIDDILIHSLLLALKKIFFYDKIIIFLEGHGRENINDLNISQTIGWFTTKYPVLFKNINNDILTNLFNTKKTLKEIPKKGIGYPLYNHNINKNQEIVFNYLGTLTEEKTDSKFNICNIPHGNEIAIENKQIETLSINSFNYNKQIYLNIDYNSAKISTQEINSLKNYWLDYIYKTIKSNENLLDYYKLDLSQINELKNKYKDIESINDLNPIQSYLFENQLIHKGNRIQNIIKSNILLKKDTVRDAFEILIKKYPILRSQIDSTFKPVLITLKKGKTEYNYQKINNISKFRNIQKNDLNKGFKLDKDPLIRLTNVEYNEYNYLIWSISHMIIDGWSFNIILNDFFTIYEKLENEINPDFDLDSQMPLKIYDNFLKNKNINKSLNYWKKQLKGLDFNQNNIKRVNYIKTEKIKLPPNIYKKILNYCKLNKITTNIFIESIWVSILQKYNKCNDVLYGKMVSGRNNIPPQYDIDKQVGIFINIIPQRINCLNNISFNQLTQIIKKQSIESQKHDYVPLSLIKNNIDNLIIFENYYKNEIKKYKSLSFYEEFDIPLILVIEIDNSFNALIEYNDNEYSQNQIKSILNDFEKLVKKIL